MFISKIKCVWKIGLLEAITHCIKIFFTQYVVMKPESLYFTLHPLKMATNEFKFIGISGSWLFYELGIIIDHLPISFYILANLDQSFKYIHICICHIIYNPIFHFHGVYFSVSSHSMTNKIKIRFGIKTINNVHSLKRAVTGTCM